MKGCFCHSIASGSPTGLSRTGSFTFKSYRAFLRWPGIVWGEVWLGWVGGILMSLLCCVNYDLGTC